MNEIIVAGGCFWGVGEYYNRLKGVDSVEVGYINSIRAEVMYQEVCSQKYKAIEAVKVRYDERVISLTKIMEHLFRIIDPTSLDKQGNDIGISYRVGAYYKNEVEKETIEKFVFSQEMNYNKEIVFEIKPVLNFTRAEEYHQDYLVKNPGGYCHVDFRKIKVEELK